VGGGRPPQPPTRLIPWAFLIVAMSISNCVDRTLEEPQGIAMDISGHLENIVKNIAKDGVTMYRF
jgi:hypothetical protein